MESYVKVEKIQNSGKTFLTARDVSIILGIEASRTRENIIRNLLESQLLTQLERGKYFITANKPSDFEISQFLYSPSYISLESALSYYGIISQFPFEITAVTPKKTAKKEINSKAYMYSHIKKDLFFGYKKVDNYLIATPEKALLDYLYMVSKAFKTENYLNEMDFSNIERDKFEQYLKTITTSTNEKLSELIGKYL